MRVPVATLLCLLALAAPAAADFTPGGSPPKACSGDFWADMVGSTSVDFLKGAFKPERIYGLNEADTLVGSDTRASCLFGGTGSDALFLGRGGGIAFGEEGRDLVLGADKSDALSGGPSGDVLFGAGGNDIIRGDAATDQLAGGDGDDAIVTDDGKAEVVDCGPGTDTAFADRSDVLLRCEKWQLSGKPLLQRRLDRDTGRKGTTFTAGFVSPEYAPPGRFRVIVAAPQCDDDPFEVARSRALRKGQRTTLTLRPPPGGWCKGAYVGAIVRSAPCPAGFTCPTRPPVQPLAWVAFAIR